MSADFVSGFMLNVFIGGIIYPFQQPDEVGLIISPVLHMREMKPWQVK